MVKPQHLLAATGITAAAIIAFFIFFQSDTAKIKKCFSTLSAQAEKSGDEHDLAAAVTARKIESLFAETVRIEIPSYDIDQTLPHSEISSHVLYARSQYRDISLKFYDFQIEFPEEGAARVTLTGILKATTRAGERVEETHEAECELKKVEDTWLLTGVKGVDVLEK